MPFEVTRPQWVDTEFTKNKSLSNPFFRKAESTLRVVRAQLDSGERLIGIRYPETLIPLVERTLGEQAMLEKARQQTMVSVLESLRGIEIKWCESFLT